jgi:protein TonB
MSTTDRDHHRPQSWEHLLDKDPYAATGFRLGVAAAVLIHLALFSVSWPTIAQPPPEQPDDNLIPIRLVDLVPPAREPEPVRIEIPERRHADVPIVPGPPDEVPEPVDRLLRDTLEIPLAPAGPISAPVDLPPPTEVAGPTGPVVVGVDVAPPRILFKVEPRYTQPALRAGIKGAVILELLIDPDGLVESVAVLRGLPLGLTRSAVEAVERWTFEPCTLDGRPVSVRYILTVHFNLR